jgi:purine-nucleoside phosphorylase
VNGDPARAAVRLRDWLDGRQPEVAVVLGSGLGGFSAGLEQARTLSFSDLPGFPRSAVAGHDGRFTVGKLGGREVLAQCGRFHLYEGHQAAVVALPVRLMARVGIRTLVVTNAAGAIHPGLEPGDLMAIQDQVNLSFRNPLFGPVAQGEMRFPDMSDPYDAGLRRLARQVAREDHIRLCEGAYAGVPGPSYETPAEIRMLRRLGADAVGMSTVLEVVAAGALGMRCFGCSIITNRAAGLGAGRLTHAEVLERAAEAGDAVFRLVGGMLAHFR